MNASMRQSVMLMLNVPIHTEASLVVAMLGTLEMVLLALVGFIIVYVVYKTVLCCH